MGKQTRPVMRLHFTGHSMFKAVHDNIKLLNFIFRCGPKLLTPCIYIYTLTADSTVQLQILL